MTELEKRIKEYLDYLEIEKNRSPKTRENYGRYLSAFRNFAKIKSPGEITAELTRDFRIHLARHSGKNGTLKKNTQAYYAIALRNFLKYLIKRDEKNVLSPDKIELPKIPGRQIDAVEYSELERILAAPQGNGLRARRDRAILETLFSTGLRLSELCALNRYLDLERGEISVRGKGGKLRVVFLSASAKKAIKEYLGERNDAEEALFVSLTKNRRKTENPPRTIGRITPRAVQRLVDFCARQAGIGRRVHPHSFRHSFATDLLINGADLRSVQELLGHSNVNTTQIYTHLTNKELKEVHRAFHGKRRN